MTIIPVSLVIPVRNEAETLSELFEALIALSAKPAEIVFVDTGSTDSSLLLLEKWAILESSEQTCCQVLKLSGGYPGAARNRGVVAATQDWIVFLDSGIVPCPDWLMNLWESQIREGSDAVFGVCRFVSDTSLGRMICALSSGYRKVLPVLPASLFRRSLFDKVGYFEEGLRSGEDLLWKKMLVDARVPMTVCNSACVEYRHFPSSLRQAFQKWFIYEQSATIAGVKSQARTVALFFVLAMYVLLLVLPHLGLALFSSYLLVRGFLDPLRRSNWTVWWTKWWQIIGMFPLAALMDLAAVLGRVTALLGVSRFRLRAG